MAGVPPVQVVGLVLETVEVIATPIPSCVTGNEEEINIEAIAQDIKENKDNFAAEHTSNARKSTWNKHTNKRAGETTGQNRNEKKGQKNKKFQKKENPNLKTRKNK